MASSSGCSRQLRKLKLSDTFYTMSGSDESECRTAPASDHAATSLSFSSAQSASIMEREKSGECSASSVEEQIEHSKVHWSLLAEPDGNEVEQRRPRNNRQDVAEVSNVEEFRALQRHPTYGAFFRTFYGDAADLFDMGELVMGKKFAEGGQAELYDVQVKWWYPEKNEEDLKEGREYALKVFKKGTFLKHLKSQLPQGLLQFSVEDIKNSESPTPQLFSRYYCNIDNGTLLKDGRFAFLMEKEHGDLRNLIERNMKLSRSKEGGPFSKEEAEFIMYFVALGVDWLHSHDIVHRDLKASNVRVYEFKKGWPKWETFVADFECSIGVVGTGFFRAPEILQACKDRKVSQNVEVFSRAADVYGYGMTCYEILTGKLPFEDHPLHGNHHLLIDLVINQHLRPELPEDVEGWTCALLERCWQFDPLKRPTIGEILNCLVENSIEVRKCDDWLKSQVC